ncbi:MAG TPA: hypothetical protein VHB21_26675, partial [Minicystis sp.]|nr:hypothetical protein [Minicystis sp.]
GGATGGAGGTGAGPVTDPEAVQPAFFGMSAGSPSDPSAWPTVPIGALGHPGLLAWGAVEPARDQFVWDYYDAQIDKAVAHHVPAYVTFGWTPKWALADTSSCTGNLCTAPPDNLQDWTFFVSEIVNRYRGKVAVWEIWNEANGPSFYTGTQAQLVALAAAAYPIVHHVDPKAIVAAPSTSGSLQSVETWLAGYLAAGGAAYADACTAHGYPAQQTPLPFPETESSNGAILTRLRGVRQVCDQNGLMGKPLYMSEGSWGQNEHLTDPDAQVAFLARYELLQAGARDELSLAGSYWYAWGHGTGAQYGSIANQDGSATPAGAAYGQVFRWVVGKRLAPCAAAADGTTITCALTDAADAGYRGLVVWTTAASGTFTVTAPYTKRRTLDGATHALAKGPLAIGPAPFLLEGHE